MPRLLLKYWISSYKSLAGRLIAGYRRKAGSLPDTVAATAWLQMYNTISQQVQTSWDRFVALQKQVDEAVADWYGFSEEMRATIAEGLPWARRRRDGSSSEEEG